MYFREGQVLWGMVAGFICFQRIVNFLALYKYDIKAINLVAYTIHSKAWCIETFSTVDQKIRLIFFFIIIFLTSTPFI